MATESVRTTQEQMQNGLSTEKIRMMIDACGSGNTALIEQLAAENPLFIRQQDFETGLSPLMAAAKTGNLELSKRLLDRGAPWNAVDRDGNCAGNHAMSGEHWELVNYLVEWGTRAELVLGEMQRCQQQAGISIIPQAPTKDPGYQSSTKSDYLKHQLRYSKDGNALLDGDDDAVMMEWERPIMKAHASIMMQAPGKRAMNVGFGMGIIDSILQEHNPALHIIIEAHPDVYQKMLKDKWDQKPNVKIFHGRWQDVIPQLAKEKVEVDAIFYDTYGEHAFDMEDFHFAMSDILSKPLGVYSFFNGLAPDNLFFHGVACQVIKLQLGKLGFDSEFLQCQIEVNDNKVWDGVRRKYWHGRDVYYLPRITWNQEYIGRKTKANSNEEHVDTDMEENSTKRQRR